MFGVKQFLVLFIFSIAFVFSSAANAQIEQEKDPDVTANQTEPEFTFEMPAEFQTELPQDKAKIIRPPKPPKEPWFSLGFLGPLFQVIFYGLLALAIAYILYLILNSVIAARRSLVKDDTVEEIPDIPIYQPDVEAARILLDDADKLANQGKFTEAVHILLFRSIQDIEDKRPHHIKRSLTSREIAGLAILSPKARDVFSQIGRLVENSFFGGKLLGSEDYELSKTAYKTFAFENVGVARATRAARSKH